MPDHEREKRLAAEAAVQLIDDGMVVGLGSGTTAAYAIRAIGELVANGLKIVGVATSDASAGLAEQAGIPLTTLDNEPIVDLTIDGADKFDDRLDLIKGGGGALLREKIVAAASRRLVIIADSRKRSNPLGGFPVPVEVIPFGSRPVVTRFEALGLRPAIRMQESEANTPFVTDEGNFIVDLGIDSIGCPRDLSDQLVTPGIVEHGLFINLAEEVYMGSGDTVKHFRR